ncbi:hypothetical protein ACFL1H_07665 [Nanoarchaeota archaeon]
MIGTITEFCKWDELITNVLVYKGDFDLDTDEGLADCLKKVIKENVYNVANVAITQHTKGEQTFQGMEPKFEDPGKTLYVESLKNHFFDQCLISMGMERAYSKKGMDKFITQDAYESFPKFKDGKERLEYLRINNEAPVFIEELRGKYLEN